MALQKNIGSRFGRFILLGEHDSQHWSLRCDCGAVVVKRKYAIRDGKVRSCGCLRREQVAALSRSHGLTGTRTYRSWAAMKNRCLNPRAQDRELYSARGIAVCDRWRDFANFLADMGERPAGTSLDRIDNNGNYEPSNCRWATAKEQGRNKRSTKLTEQDVIDLRFAFQYARPPHRVLAQAWGISVEYVNDLLHRMARR